MVTPPSRSFTFDGRPTVVPDGRPITDAELGPFPPILQRSIRYHRPRAPLCGVGDCTNCLIRVNGRPNVRACQYVPVDGDRVETENAWPSSRWDAQGALDFVFPRGIDTVRGFRRPAAFTRLYQRVVRRLAGYGSFPTPDPGGPNYTGRRLETDVVVIGDGEAGRAAYERLTRAGRSVVVVERRGRPGAPIPGDAALYGAVAAFLPPPSGSERRFDLVAVRDSRESVRIGAHHVVVAAGGYDAPLVFAGSDRPGVLTGDGAVALGTASAARFSRALLVGGGPRAAELFDRFPGRIAAVVAPGAIVGEVARRASERSVPLYPRTLVLEARGRRRVRSVRLAPRGPGAAFSVEVDAVVLAPRRLPHVQLFFQAGASMLWAPDVGAYRPRADPSGATSVPGLFVAGTAAGPREHADALASGRIVADAILDGHAFVPRLNPPTPGPHELEAYYRELRAALPRRPKCVVCACEDVLLTEVEEAVAHGFTGIEVVKRYTGVGTGLCQGRYCVPETLMLLAGLEHRPAPDVGYLTQRPPVVPVPLGALAELPDDPPGAGGPSA